MKKTSSSGTKKVHAQCIRLYSCIQAAVAAVMGANESHKKSAASRVKLLLRIIPPNPQIPIGM